MVCTAVWLAVSLRLRKLAATLSDARARQSDAACVEVLLEECGQRAAVQRAASAGLDMLDATRARAVLRRHGRRARVALLSACYYAYRGDTTPGSALRDVLRQWTRIGQEREAVQLKRSILGAIERAGDTSFAPCVRRLAAKTRSPSLRAAAEQCLLALEAAAARASDPALLLHPADNPGAGDALMRAVDAGSVASEIGRKEPPGHSSAATALRAGEAPAERDADST